MLLGAASCHEDDRRRLLADVVEQSEELSALIGDLIELARGDLPHDMVEDIRLDRIVEESLSRARRDNPEVVFEASLQPVTVEGVPERLGRAVNNLLDNAARHSPPDGVVEVTVNADGLRVRDHGTGVDEADLPYVFDRFYRGKNSRGRQGSGLGLAIVRQVAVQLGGSVDVSNAPDGGAIFTLHLPTVERRRTASTPDVRLWAGGDARLSSDQEALPQEPEHHREDRHDHHRAAAGADWARRRAPRTPPRRRPRAAPPAASCASGSPRSARAP